MLRVGDALSSRLFLIRDRDTKFSGVFDEVSRTDGLRVIRTPGGRTRMQSAGWEPFGGSAWTGSSSWAAGTWRR